VIRLREIAGGEEGLARMLHVVLPNRVGEDRREIIDAGARGLHQLSVIEREMHRARVDETPPVAEPVGVVALDVKALRRVVLENGDGVVAAFGQKLDRFATLLRRVKPIEENWTATPLRVPDFPDENGFARGFAPTVEL